MPWAPFSFVYMAARVFSTEKRRGSFCFAVGPAVRTVRPERPSSMLHGSALLPGPAGTVLGSLLEHTISYPGSAWMSETKRSLGISSQAFGFLFRLGRSGMLDGGGPPLPAPGPAASAHAR